MGRMALEEKVPHAHDADAVDVRVVGTLPHDHDLLVVVSYRLQRSNLALPGLACEYLVSRLHVKHAPVLRRDEVDFLAVELAHMHAPPFVEQLEIHGVLEQVASIRDPIAGHPGSEAGAKRFSQKISSCPLEDPPFLHELGDVGMDDAVPLLNGVASR